MLYVTTRGNKDAFTAHHALTENSAKDGGRYIPFQMPHYSEDELFALKENPFGQVVADILNRFFASRLTGWDVDCCIGRTAFKLNLIRHKIQIAELWHNPQTSYKYIVESLYNRVAQTDNGNVTEWFSIAMRIAVLFGLYSQMNAQGCLSANETFDVCVAADDFSGIMAATYARNMGLPVQKIICTELEDSYLWDLIQRGAFSTLLGRHMSDGIERMLHATLGSSVAKQFREKCEQKQNFTLDDVQHNSLRDVYFGSVVSKSRINGIISSVYRSNDYILDPRTALCHGGLQDYRSKTGVSRVTLLFADDTPLNFCEQITNATGMDTRILADRIRSF